MNLLALILEFSIRSNMNNKSLLSILVFLILFLPVSKSWSQANSSHEVVVRTSNNFTSAEDVNQFMEQAKKAHVQVVHLAVKQDEDDEIISGMVFYKSKIAPIAKGYQNFDVLDSAIQEAHRRDIKLYAWIPQFHDQVAVKKNSQWQMMQLKNGKVIPFTGTERPEYFVNPIHPEVQAYEKSLILEVAENYPVDGIDLDWVRFDGFNMDMGEHTRSLAMKEIGLDPVTLNFSENEKLKKWNEWRGKKIADYVHQVKMALKDSKRKLALGAFILPQEFVEVGQNLSFFAQDLDEVMPMAYWRDWGFTQNWVAQNCLKDVEVKTKAAQSLTLIKPTLDISSEKEMKTVIKDLKTQFVQISKFIWFSYYKW
ncbi:MAG: family 10 glycosylhydrolase, partial [Bdellovibrio sp.]